MYNKINSKSLFIVIYRHFLTNISLLKKENVTRKNSKISLSYLSLFYFKTERVEKSKTRDGILIKYFKEADTDNITHISYLIID